MLPSPLHGSPFVPTLHLSILLQAYNYETQKLAILSQEESAIWVGGAAAAALKQRHSCLPCSAGCAACPLWLLTPLGDSTLLVWRWGGLCRLGLNTR